MFLEDLVNQGIPETLAVFFGSALPILELRVAIPVAIEIFNFPWYHAIVLAVIGNLLPVPFILLFLDATTRLLGRVALFKKWLDWLFERTRHRGQVITKYKRIGLILFVAIPLPVTGAWTGSLAAVLFGLSFRNAFLSIAIGVVIAGIIVTFLTLLGWVGAVLAGVALIGLAVYGLWQVWS